MAISSITSTATHKEKTGQNVSRKGGFVGVFKFTFLIWHTLFSFEFFHRFPARSHSFSHIRKLVSSRVFFTCGSSLPRRAEACWGPEIKKIINIISDIVHVLLVPTWWQEQFWLFGARGPPPRLSSQSAHLYIGTKTIQLLNLFFNIIF